ncbi:MAG: biotin/lipoyl-binding protein [Candidatus Arsenophonus phytopathogenicus]
MSGHSQVIQAYEQSRLTELHVKKGQHVKKGEPLITLDALGC